MEPKKITRKVDLEKRASDRGGTSPINPAKLGPTDRLHRRVEGVVSSAIRMSCDRIHVVHCPEGMREVELLTQHLTVDDDDPSRETPRSIVDAIVLALQDEASALPEGASHAFSLRGGREDATDVVRERVRLVGTRKLPERDRDSGEGDELDDHDRALAATSRLGTTMHPREVATVMGMARQQMRHNEALASIVAKMAGSTIDSQAKIIESLSQRNIALSEKLERQADAYVDTARKQRVLEAEARSEEAKGKAIEVTAQVIKEFLPVALHRVSRKYGLAGDAAVDPMIEKIMETFDEDQLPRLQAVLTPLQQALFAEAWILVQDRQAQRDAEAKKKKGEDDKKLPEGASSNAGE